MRPQEGALYHGIPGWLWLCLAIMAKSLDRFRMLLLFLVATYGYISELPPLHLGIISHLLLLPVFPSDSMATGKMALREDAKMTYLV